MLDEEINHGAVITWQNVWSWSLSITFSYLEYSSSHYSDVIMSAMASQITSLTITYSIVYSGAVQRKHQSSASLAFVRGIHQGPVNSPHKGPVTRKMFPFDDVIMAMIFGYSWWKAVFRFRFDSLTETEMLFRGTGNFAKMITFATGSNEDIVGWHFI